MAEAAKKKRAKRGTKKAAAPPPQPMSPPPIPFVPEAPQGKKEKSSAPKNDKNQFWSIVLFASGVLIALITLIDGSSGWHGVHNMLRGMFGVAVFFIPAILIYTSIQIGRERTQKNVAGRAGWGIGMTFLFSAAVQIFLVGVIPGDELLRHFPALYEDGVKLKGGGLASFPIAGVLLKIFGTTGARITVIVLFFVFALLLSGLGLIDFLKSLTRPFAFVGRCIDDLKYILTGEEYDDAYDDLEDEDEELPPMPPPIPTPEMEAHAMERELPPPNIFPNIPEPEPQPVYDPDLEALSFIEERDRNMPKNETFKINMNGVIDGFLMDVPIHDSRQNIPEPINYNEEEPKADNDELEKLICKAAGTTYGETAEVIEDEEECQQTEIVLEPMYILPPIDLLTLPKNSSNGAAAAQEMREKADTIVNTLRSFGVEVRIKDIFRGPSITRYEVQPGTGVKISRIKNLDADIALSLAASGVRISPVPGKPVVGIEVPNGQRDMVSLREMLDSNEFHNASSKLTFAVGKDIAGNCILGDISKMPHVIIAGTTGSGKSVCTRSIIMSILFNAKPNEVKLILIDPKMVEFKVFDGIPHLLTPIIIEAKKAPGALNWAVNEMLKRYKMLSESGTNDLKSYNEYAKANSLDPMPQIVIFIDELADMMLVAKNEVEDSIQRLAQMGRAAGMHLVVATQRPTTDVITGTIKANIPSRIALSVMSATDSRTIIDDGGADKLLGNGDMLYKPIGLNEPMRVQGCFASNSEIQATIQYIKAQGEAEYDHSVTEAVESYVPQTKGGDRSEGGDSNISGEDEELLFRAMEIAVTNGQVSTTMLQKKLRLGYAKASRIIDELEERDVIGPSEGSKPRKVYMSRMQFDDMKLRRMQDID